MTDVPVYPSYNLARVEHDSGAPMAAIESLVFGAVMRAAVKDSDTAEQELVDWLDKTARAQ